MGLRHASEPAVEAWRLRMGRRTVPGVQPKRRDAMEDDLRDHRPGARQAGAVTAPTEALRASHRCSGSTHKPDQPQRRGRYLPTRSAWQRLHIQLPFHLRRLRQNEPIVLATHLHVQIHASLLSRPRTWLLS